MKKIVAWIRRREYQWEREDYRRVCDIILWVMAIGGVGFLITMMLVKQYAVAVSLWALFFGATFGSGWAIKWADMRLKRTRKVGLGGKG